MQESRIRLAGLLAASLIGLGGLTSANALERPADEKAKLKACEKQLCTIILKKETSGPDLTCNVGRTWEKSKIVKGVKEKRISWTFGDARCTVNVKMPRSGIINALTKPSHELALEKHTISCQVERTDGIDTVKIDMAPKMSFKGGKAEKTWLNVSNIEAPTLIKGALWTVSTIEDNLGLFHSEMIEEINEFIHEKCAKRHG